MIGVLPSEELESVGICHLASVNPSAHDLMDQIIGHGFFTQYQLVENGRFVLELLVVVCDTRWVEVFGLPHTQFLSDFVDEKYEIILRLFEPLLVFDEFLVDRGQHPSEDALLQADPEKFGQGLGRVVPRGEHHGIIEI